MEHNHLLWPEEKGALYALAEERLRALTEGVPYPVANLANASALLAEAMSDINWVGFYLLRGDRLVLGPFQGRTACIEIPLGRGVCGTAAARNRAQLVYDVHQFPGHIPCDSDSNAEIVLPLRGRDGAVLGVLDIDSPTVGRFTQEDLEGLERIAAVIEKLLEHKEEQP